MISLKHIGYFLLLWFLTSACEAQEFNRDPNIPPKYEFRAFWIVTLDNKDFPSQPGLSSQAQKNELTEILDFHQKRGMNAAIFQVRPAGDAFYASKYEPWSQWLTGRQGQAPSPYYDPLKFIIEEGHKRNMEIHAWFNPYRAVFSLDKSDMTAYQAMRKNPEWFLEYDNKLHFNPGIPEVRNYIANVVMDVVRRYDIDGIQFDDYFYPYRKGNKDFPDEETFVKYQGNFAHKSDWRRNNVDILIKMIHDSLRAVKPYVKFGISPMGVWRNKSEDSRGSNTSVGQTAYDYLGADVIKWLEEGWIDYIAPQLYWSIGHKRADYATLSNWWAENHFGRHLYIGQAFYKIDDDEGDKNWRKISELPNQIRINRSLKNVMGSIYFRAKSLMNNNNALSDTLYKSFYRYPALIPPMTWKDATPPPPIQNLRADKSPKRFILQWENGQYENPSDSTAYYVIYRFKDTEKIDLNKVENIVAIQKDRIFYEKKPKATALSYTYVVTAVDRLHNESEAVKVTVF